MTPDAAPDARADGAALRELVAQCVDRLETEGESALEELAQQHPEHASALRERIIRLRAVGLLPVAGEASPGVPERLGEFRLLARLGGGGMGVVYLAEQPSLRRRVALKLVRPEHLYFGQARERFQREAAAVARLAHPGIVPVHAVGDEGGIPWLAMEHVRGATLDELVRELADRPPARLSGRDLRAALEAVVGRRDAQLGEHPGPAAPPPGSEADARLFGGSFLEAALRIVRTVAEALEHAHERGVLHRDIKPANVMLAADGRVLLLDFGLATAEGTSRLTASGAQLGSLAYMAPEQLRGEHGRVDARSDVYSLGVTLYELLALRPAFAADTAHATLRDVLRAEPPALRAVNPAVPRDVETVCLVAMDPDPPRRYASAAAFAADLGRALERRPIVARPVGPLLRARRWSQRHPALAVTLALGLLILVGGPTGWAIQEHGKRLAVEEQKRQTDEQRKEAEAQRARAEEQRVAADDQRAKAEANLVAALEAVDQMLARVGDETLADVPQMEGVRRALLDDAVAFCDQLMQRHGDDPALRLMAGRTQARVARLRVLLGDVAGAERAWLEAARLFDAAATEAPADLEPRFLAAHARADLGESLMAVPERVSDAHDLLARGLSELAALPPQPDDAGARDSLAASYRQDLARTLELLGRPDEAQTEYERSAQELRELLAADPGRTELQRALATTLSETGRLIAGRGETDRAEEMQREAVTLFEAVVAARPAAADARLDLALARSQLGSLVFARGDLEGAEQQVRASLADLDRLVTDFPAVPRYRMNQAALLNGLAVIATSAQHDDVAAEAYDRAIEVLTGVEQAFPATPGIDSQIAAAQVNFADFHVRAGRTAEALPPLRESIARRNRLFAANPTDPLVLAFIDLQTYELIQLLPSWTDAEELAGYAREIPRQAPDDPQWCTQPAQMLLRCAELAGDDAPRAAAFRAEAIGLLGQAVDRGWKSGTALRESSLWAPLRGEPGWDALLAQADAP
jgi:eukaryotic-like serine/threonine-protein kinase